MAKSRTHASALEVPRRRLAASPTPKRRSMARSPKSLFSGPPRRLPRQPSIRWRITRPTPNIAATSCVRWSAAHWRAVCEPHAPLNRASAGRNMTAYTKGSGATWVGRSIRRLEDPALVTGRGRFTGDLAAAHWVRFVRSPVASGRIGSIKAPPGAWIVTAGDLAGVKPIRPMLHKFAYRPVAQPILAEGVVRFVGEPLAAVIAASREEAEDVADQVIADISATAAVIDCRAA